MKKKLWLITIILIFISITILPREVTDLDEIWNFNFARCVANGLVPYKDFNIIQGPFVPIICGIILKIISQEMLILRILAIILDTVILYMVCSIMKQLKIKEYLKNISLIILAIIMKQYFTLDYNWMILLFILLILKLELQEEISIKKDLIIGILAGTCITIKQTMGLVIVFAVIGYKILEIRKKQDIRVYIKRASIRLMGILIPIIIMFIYLLSNHCLVDYIDYCILGIATFSNKVSYIDRLIKNQNILIRILSFLPIINIGFIVTYFIKKDKNMLILACFSIVNMIIVYPISDESHFVIGICLTIIGFMYIINLWTVKIKVKRKEELMINSFLECAMTLSVIIFLFIFVTNTQNLNTRISTF